MIGTLVDILIGSLLALAIVVVVGLTLIVILAGYRAARERLFK